MAGIDEKRRFIAVNIAVMTVSDTRTEADDKSGGVLIQRLTEAGHNLAARAIVRDEADAMLDRHSGDPDQPRILGAFNEPTPDWLSFFMFTYFTDRDGKFQLGALRESAFDPLSRTCDFMLKEEAYHMFVGASGVGRVVQRSRLRWNR